MAQLLGAILVLFAIFMVTGLVLALVGAVVVLFGAALLIAVLVGICKGIAQVRREHRAERIAREQAEQTRLRRITERAEREHQLYMRGDLRGVYGRYEPVDLDASSWTWHAQAGRTAEWVPVPKVKKKKKKGKKH